MEKPGAGHCALEAVTPEFARAARLTEEHKGVRVVDVNISGPARNRLFPDDIITAVLFPTPRKEVRGMSDLQGVLSKAKAGELVSLLIFDARANLTRVANIRVGAE